MDIMPNPHSTQLTKRRSVWSDIQPDMLLSHAGCSWSDKMIQIIKCIIFWGAKNYEL